MTNWFILSVQTRGGKEKEEDKGVGRQTILTKGQEFLTYWPPYSSWGDKPTSHLFPSNRPVQLILTEETNKLNHKPIPHTSVKYIDTEWRGVLTYRFQPDIWNTAIWPPVILPDIEDTLVSYHLFPPCMLCFLPIWPPDSFLRYYVSYSSYPLLSSRHTDSFPFLPSLSSRTKGIHLLIAMTTFIRGMWFWLLLILFCCY